MKLPEKIKGRNRIRDGAIVSLWVRNDMTLERIAEKFKLTVRRIQQILYNNRAFVKIDKEWERVKRIHRLKEILKTAPKSNLDEIGVMQEIRKEIEGDGESQRSSTSKIVIVYPTQNNQQPNPNRMEIVKTIEDRA